MKWTRGHESEDVEDRRGQAPASSGGLSGGGLQLPLMLFSRFGFPGLILGAALLYFTGGLGSLTGSSESAPSGATPDAQIGDEQAQAQFVSFVLDDVQNTWAEMLGPEYQRAKMVLFRGSTRSGCGMGEAAMGPFYCPADQRVYLDLAFYDDLRRRFGAAGDFALAYVVAHEVGHHVQNLLGISDKVHRAPESQQRGAQGLSVRLELQADCLAGAWGAHASAETRLEEGDLEEALRAAAAIGDDQLQRKSGGVVRPESWTHGSSEQRTHWFQQGFRNGTLKACDTFSSEQI